MDNTVRRRGRSSNFTIDEQALLLELTMTKRNVLENKSSGAGAIDKKHLVWSKICHEFNARSPADVSAETLKYAFFILKII